MKIKPIEFTDRLGMIYERNGKNGGNNTPNEVVWMSQELMEEVRNQKVSFIYKFEMKIRYRAIDVD